MEENPYQSPNDNSSKSKAKRKFGRALLVFGLPLAVAIALATTCASSEIFTPETMIIQFLGLIVATWAGMLILDRTVQR